MHTLHPIGSRKAHNVGLLGVQEWGANTIRQGRGNKLHVWLRIQELPGIRRSAALSDSPVPVFVDALAAEQQRNSLVQGSILRGPAALHSFCRGRRFHAIRHPPSAPPHPRSSVEKPRLHLSKPETLNALDTVRGRLDIAHFFWLSWDYCGHAVFLRTRRRTFGRFHVGATLCAAEVVQRSLVWCRKMSIPEAISKDMQEMGQVEEYKLYGPELRDVTSMTGNIRLPFLHTLYAGDPRVSRSIIAPKRFISSYSTNGSGRRTFSPFRF
ncbi:uncharacterized protein ARMOST_06394 [Armillaria ostoyae]|uniref:Uncharacterized protein n=1 Tax=Armillaria ostoyae TaxID=47428 RepID=A0A284R2U9_ARMOS|nr:uncharacterized protein ARMOST_06394 [Armillaria ostoyae]